MRSFVLSLEHTLVWKKLRRKIKDNRLTQIHTEIAIEMLIFIAYILTDILLITC